MEPPGADWSPDSELELQEMLLAPELKASDELKKKKKTRVSKKMVNDVISEAQEPLSRGEILWRLLLLDRDVCCVCSRNLEPQLDSKSLLSAINKQVAENSSEPSRESTRQNASEDSLLPMKMKCMLEKELEEWSDWASQKVMQAAERLSKDREELRLLRLQKQNRLFVEALRRQHASLKEGKIALAKGLKEKARLMATLNDQLRMELKDAESHAAEEEANCEQASRRMEETLKKLQSSEEDKLLLRDQLAAEKRRLHQLQQQFEQARDLHDNNAKSEWKKEEKLKEALEMAKTERKEQEQIEMSAKLQENALKIEAENNLQRCKNDILQLKNQMAQLKLEGSSQASSNLTEESKSELKREWECVMCLSEIVSVVLLPCAHQAFCRQCNEIHEQKGAKECPSCRTPIQRRVLVRSADDP